MHQAGPQIARSVFISALLILIMAALILIGLPLQSYHFIIGTVVTEWGLIGLPVLLLLIRRVIDASPLQVKNISARHLTGAALGGISGWYLVSVLVESLQEQVLPIPPKLIEEMRQVLFNTNRSVALDLFTLAISPAICEELLFRGALLQICYPALPRFTAIMINGVLFGLFHLSIYKFFPTMLLGMTLAYIAIVSNSLYPAMLFHFLNNAIALFVGRYFDPIAIHLNYARLIIVSLIAVILFVLGLYLVSIPKRAADKSSAGGI